MTACSYCHLCFCFERNSKCERIKFYNCIVSLRPTEVSNAVIIASVEDIQRKNSIARIVFNWSINCQLRIKITVDSFSQHACMVWSVVNEVVQ